MRFLSSALIRSPKWRDLWVMLAVLVLIWIPISEMDLYEWFYQLSREHEDWDLDEIVMLALLVPVPLGWYTWRRMREAQMQTERLLDVERQLSHARKLDGLGTLAAGMAHQVNNQLQPVVGLSELMVMQADEADPNLRQLEMMRDAAMRARASLDTVLRIARRGGKQIQTDDVDHNMADLVDMLSLSCPSDVAFSPTVGRGLPVPKMPWDDLESVMMNLFSNAVQALDGPQGAISFTAMPGKMKGQKGLMLSLSDNGSGIPPEVLSRIFEPYYTSKPVGEGTGLGLWQVQELLRKAGGHIAVDSQPGHGARFDIWVPVHAPKPQPIA